MNIAAYLQAKALPFEALEHRDTFDARSLALELSVPGREVAKTVLLRADHGYAYLVAVLPSNRQIDFKSASEALGGSWIELASEDEVSERCPDCEPGVLPPFGSQYGMTTLVDETLTRDEEIVFEGNTHHDAIRMRFDDFRKLEEPLIVHITR